MYSTYYSAGGNQRTVQQNQSRTKPERVIGVTPRSMQNGNASGPMVKRNN